jgi:hypothetical protein
MRARTPPALRQLRPDAPTRLNTRERMPSAQPGLWMALWRTCAKRRSSCADLWDCLCTSKKNLKKYGA